jgi:riboflavin synthase
LRAPLVASDARLGDSVAVNGCCLTVTACDGEALAFDLLGETLDRTNLGDLAPGAPVNLERALAAHARLGGHFVQGHIDTTGRVLAFEPVGADHRLEIALPAEFARYVAFKGSIAIDGISLTVAEVGVESFVVWIIPHTLAVTNLRAKKPGEAVNLEFDLLAKYVERILATR